MRILALLLLIAQFSTGVDLVEVYVAATQANGEPLENLAQTDFTVLENGTVQTIQTFARGDFPLSVALAIDRSYSMAGAPLRLARQGAKVFLASLRREDQAVVLAVGTEVEALGQLSTDRAAQAEALDSLVVGGTTSLHDAIVTSIERLSEGSGRRALILLSDGHDRYSTATEHEVLERARGADVLIYGITLAREPSALFGALAEITGGRAFHVITPQQFEGIFRTIARDLRTQYLLGYAPPAGAAGWRKIEVRTSRPDVRLRARSGYVAR